MIGPSRDSAHRERANGNGGEQPEIPSEERLLRVVSQASPAEVAMASPRLETFCCPNRDAATQLVLTFQPGVFCGVCIGSASASLLLSALQLLPKKGQGRRKTPKASSSTTILLLISACDMLGGLGKGPRAAGLAMRRTEHAAVRPGICSDFEHAAERP